MHFCCHQLHLLRRLPCTSVSHHSHNFWQTSNSQSIAFLEASIADFWGHYILAGSVSSNNCFLIVNHTLLSCPLLQTCIWTCTFHWEPSRIKNSKFLIAAHLCLLWPYDLSATLH
ncbi:hypothetical protein O6H91_06G087700 [Diphasiastrum complanatum]|uniref:Uncharacterized protein n=1 Tax=Diphasiastrum complanatum TaxID=34168 RepID=A0ACC2DGT3_DIPCM|nr:hypothetical protein O6H91_06G087700 [Diphasiastrum complanatum]